MSLLTEDQLKRLQVIASSPEECYRSRCYQCSLKDPVILDCVLRIYDGCDVGFNEFFKNISRKAKEMLNAELKKIIES